jgi:YHS domain-containing protein
MKKISLLLAIAAIAAPISAVSLATLVQARPVYVDSDIADAAVSGYDVVSYFQGNGQPQKGSDKFTVQNDGVTYMFASAENAAMFKAEPAKFAPQYGGHCAWAMSRGSLAPGDPTLYKIVDGKLYLNFNQQVQQTWLKDIPGFVSKANAEWPKIPDDAAFGG